MPKGYSLYAQRNGATLAERLARFSLRNANGCLEWCGATSKNGYGAVTDPGNGQMRTHRAAWIVKYGAIPAGQNVCHHCDNRACVEPTHLFLGNTADNLRDMRAKGRQARGERHGRAKLTAEKVLAIRADLRHPKIIAAEYGLSRPYVIRLRHGEKWAHLPKTTI